MAKDDGKVIKAVRMDGQPVIVEERQVFPVTMPVTNLVIHRGRAGRASDARLIVSSHSELVALKLRMCYGNKVASCRFANDRADFIGPCINNVVIIAQLKRVRQVARSLLRLG